MGRRIPLPAAFTLCVAAILAGALAAATSALAADAFSGTIYFRDGSAVAFVRIGNLSEISPCGLYGKFKSQNFKVECSEVKEIDFSEPETQYEGASTGGVVVTSRSGEHFTLTQARINAPTSGSFNYVFKDPITGALKATYAKVARNVSHIVIGGKVGQMRYNPANKMFFPALYNYDPFTGAKLEWATPQ